jgi:protocatechuate 3,4-dioxygenase beta subunit
MCRFSLFLLAILSSASTIAQNGIIKGRILDAANNQGVPFANVSVDGTELGVSSDLDGNYLFEGMEPGTYNITASFFRLQNP